MANSTFDPITDDFAGFEASIYRKHQLAAEQEILDSLQLTLRSVAFFAVLKAAAAKAGYRYIGYRYIHVRLQSGSRYRIHSPAFIKAKPKDRRRRKRRRNVLTHLGLEYLGFCRKCSPSFVACVVQMAALCPSFDTASTVLGSLGITANDQLVRRLSYDAVDRIWGQAPQIVVDDHYRKPGIRIQVCIDGARVRQRIDFKGPKGKGKKLHRYHRDWFEPRLFSIVLVDEKGKIIRKLDGEKVRPIYDGRSEVTLDATFELLEEYLREINLAEAASISFCADGGNGLWPRISALIEELELPTEKVQQVLDHMHAKQNLRHLVEKIRDGGGIFGYQFAATLAKFEKWLWTGDTASMRSFIETAMKRKRAKKTALKKLDGYFGTGARMRYAAFRAAGIPLGSGAIESAIRRVINLRIKSPGTFWKRDNVERMIFLRCQVIVGRWQTVWRRHCELMRKSLASGDFSELQKAA